MFIWSHSFGASLSELFFQAKLSEGDIRTLTRQEHERCRVDALNALEKILRLERVPLYTQNVDCLQAEASKWLAKYINLRWPDELLRTAFADELNVMAKVQAYFQVAYKVGGIWDHRFRR